MKTLLFAGLAAVALAMSPSAAALEQINVNGTQRALKVHVPEALPAGAPLVIACHGANQSADWHDEHSAWKAVADTAKFVLVFPNAVGRSVAASNRGQGTLAVGGRRACHDQCRGLEFHASLEPRA